MMRYVQSLALPALCVGIVLLARNLRGRFLKTPGEVVVVILTTIAGVILTTIAGVILTTIAGVILTFLGLLLVLLAPDVH